jgi:hypothetical protein
MTSQLFTFIIATILSWYGMMMLHETGHCVGALLSGGAIESVDIPLLGFSQTHYRENPHPLFTVWAGPVGGALFALFLFGLCIFLKGRTKQLVLYFCGFSLIANGIYIGVGGFDRVGDCAVLLNHGASLWHLVLFGIVTVCLGGYCWHRMGAVQDWFKR